MSERYSSPSRQPKRRRVTDRRLKAIDARTQLQLYAGALMDQVERQYDAEPFRCEQVLLKLLDAIELAHSLLQDDANARRNARAFVRLLEELY